ncbi:MAG: hypothetical protein LUQ22_01865 [Methanotrichaceae archaeon]|nr:hypothetical protein [Methanotrichaceae archaeon]
MDPSVFVPKLVLYTIEESGSVSGIESSEMQGDYAWVGHRNSGLNAIG